MAGVFSTTTMSGRRARVEESRVEIVLGGHNPGLPRRVVVMPSHLRVEVVGVSVCAGSACAACAACAVCAVRCLALRHTAPIAPAGLNAPRKSPMNPRCTPPLVTSGPTTQLRSSNPLFKSVCSLLCFFAFASAHTRANGRGRGGVAPTHGEVGVPSPSLPG